MSHTTQSNEWVRIKDNIATVGITKKAAGELEEVSFIELPGIGAHISPEDTAVVIESTKAAIDFSFPIHGEVVEVNEALRSNPGLLLQAPEQEGWLFRCRISS